MTGYGILREIKKRYYKGIVIFHNVMELKFYIIVWNTVI